MTIAVDLEVKQHNKQRNNTKKSHFWRENVTVLPSFTERYNERH